MTNELAQRIADGLLKKLNAERTVADIETRSTGITAARLARKELAEATAALDAAVKAVKS